MSDKGPDWPNWQRGASSSEGRRWKLLDDISDGCAGACCGEVLFWIIFGLVALIAGLIAYLRN